MRRFVLLLLAIAPLSGCGGVDGSLFATAVHNTQAAGGAEIAFQWNYEIPGRDQPVVMLGSGVEDAGGQTAQITAHVPGGGELEAVGAGQVFYMRSDLFGEELRGKEWMKLDFDRVDKGLGIEIDSLGQVGEGTSDQLQALAQISDGVSDEGQETVRGTETTHYSATVDLRRLPGKGIDKLIELSGGSQFNVDVWLDDDERVRRMEWAQDLPGTGGVRMTMIMEYVRFGVPVHIDTPDDGDVFDATDMAIHSLQQQLGSSAWDRS
jgi:hypothetical protein